MLIFLLYIEHDHDRRVCSLFLGDILTGSWWKLKTDPFAPPSPSSSLFFPPFFHSHSLSHSRKNPITEIPVPCWKRDSLWNVFSVKQRQCLSCARANRKLCAGEQHQIRTDNGKRERQRRKKLRQSRGKERKKTVGEGWWWWWSSDWMRGRNAVTVSLDPPTQRKYILLSVVLFTTSCFFLAAWKLIMTSLKKENNHRFTPWHLYYRENSKMCSVSILPVNLKKHFIYSAPRIMSDLRILTKRADSDTALKMYPSGAKMRKDRIKWRK